MSVQILHSILSAAGLPVVCVRKMPDGSYTADLDAAATPEQINQAAQLLASEAANAEASAAAMQTRIATDTAEEQQAKIDAQIQSDLSMTPAEVNSTVDTLFAGFTAPQRTFLKRLVRMVLAAARKVLR